ncbi:MAG: type II toxin-antitoxin system VapC family toxin, partial [Elusimicrobiota bacterium]
YTAMLANNQDVFKAVIDADCVYISVIVVGELLAGFKMGSREKQNCKDLQSFLEKSTVKIVNATMATAEIFSEVKRRLKHKGTPIPVNDMWIAAHAIETGSYLISMDKHFKDIPALLVWEN